MDNPFKILGVDRMATKKEILQQAMAVLQQNQPCDARTIAVAQKNLFAPLTRAEAEFRHCLDTNFLAGTTPIVPEEGAVPDITLLDIFHAKNTTER